MSNLLVVILLTKPQRNLDWGKPTGPWKDILTVIRTLTSFDVTHEGTTSAAPGSPIPVFRSLTSTSQPVGSSLSGDPDGHNEELLGIFFQVALPEAVGVEKLLSGLSQLPADVSGDPGTIASIDCRVYRPYNQLKPEVYVPTGEGTLVLNCMTPSAESEETFNRWYAEEHIPMLRAVPGWRSSTRYILVNSKCSVSYSAAKPVGVPKYFALHEWVGDKVFQTTEYKAAVDTPWRTEVMAGVQEKQRFVLQYIGKLREEV
ncbi:hypothetical protein D9756_005565 [Leucocoprinus leucothites]|uniref:EthD domain-containing protein n=1 Tax=Leucocoprinus leucothites TaxID=201217 RepID=A0A8H5DA78_9AGAR|nr:hypothetical protein D9756_005565 [Leucoagaricus leucothites]